MLTSVARLSTRASLGVAAFAAPLAFSASALCGASIRPTQSSITAAPARFVSQENFKRMVRTTKHVMTDIPAPIVPVLVPQEVAADAEPTDVRFSHPMPAFFDAASPTTEIANNELFAVVDVNGRQFKVAAGDLIMADHIKGVVIGDQLSIDRVLLAGSRDFTVLGKPTVASARVLVTVEEQTKLAPRMVFHMRRRTGFHNLKRFADMITVLRVDAVELADAPAARPEAEIAPAVPVRGGATATPILVRGRTKSTLVIGTANTNAPAAAEAGAQ